MNEYRTRLIADVVTGQLDVRDLRRTCATRNRSRCPAAGGTMRRWDADYQ